MTKYYTTCVQFFKKYLGLGSEHEQKILVEALHAIETKSLNESIKVSNNFLFIKSKGATKRKLKANSCQLNHIYKYANISP